MADTQQISVMSVADDLTHEEWVKCNVADDGDMTK